MSGKKNGGPAFQWNADREVHGMTLRDYFAAKATEEDIRAVMKFGEAMSDPCDRADARYRHADAMLKAREA